ncbi:MAG: hypothetical protein IKA63_05310 [Clostridia bacterium]|nr:hypothetical protein [Clostridia bacterium]
MTKGISRQIVEITDTGSPYFERVLLVVRAGCADHPSPQLEQEAHRLLRAENGYSGLRRARKVTHLRRAAWFAAGSGLGAALSLLLYTLL